MMKIDLLQKENVRRKIKENSNKNKMKSNMKERERNRTAFAERSSQRESEIDIQKIQLHRDSCFACSRNNPRCYS